MSIEEFKELQKLLKRFNENLITSYKPTIEDVQNLLDNIILNHSTSK